MPGLPIACRSTAALQAYYIREELLAGLDLQSTEPAPNLDNEGDGEAKPKDSGGGKGGKAPPIIPEAVVSVRLSCAAQLKIVVYFITLWSLGT